MEDPERFARGYHPDSPAVGPDPQTSFRGQPVCLPQHASGTTEPNLTAAPPRGRAERLPGRPERPRILLEHVDAVSQ